MAKTRSVLNRFNSGEFSGKMDALVDYQRYYNACRIMENAIPIPQGGVMRRPGTYYVGAMQNSAVKGKLQPFHFSTVQAYILEFGDYILRFYKDGGQIVMSYSAWLTATAYAIGDLVTNGGSYYRCRIAHTSGTFATDLGNYYWEETGGEADLAYEIPTDYAEADLFDLKFVPSNDVLYIVHPSYPVKKLTRTGHTAWTLTNVTFTYDEPETISGATQANPCVLTVTGHGFDAGDEVVVLSVVGMTQLNNRIFTVSAPATNTIALKGVNSTAYGAYISGGTVARNPYIGKAKAITGITKANPGVVSCADHGYSNGDTVLIRDVVGMTEVNDKIYTVANADDDTFELSGVDTSGYTVYTSGGVVRAKPFTATNEYPSCGCFFEQRLLLALDQTVWGSRTGDYENFQAGTLDDHAFSYIIASDKVDTIQWMIAQDYCMIGTIGGVWKLWGGSSDEPITPSAVTARKQTGFGTIGIEPEMVDDTILFVQRGGRRVRELGYSIEKDGYIANDMSILAEHIAKGATQATSGISDIDYQAEPFSILWCVRKDGQLLGFIRDRAQQVAGWFRIVTGKASSVATDTVESVVSTETESGETITLTVTRTEANPTVDSWDEIESVAVITNESEEDEVWISVKRTVDGSVVRYIEYFMPLEFFSVLADYFGVDSGLTYDGGDAVDITGITNADPAVVTAPGHTFTDGQKVRITGVEGMTEANIGLTTAYEVDNAAGNTFELKDIDSTEWGEYTEGGTAQIVTNGITGLDHLEGKTVDIMMDGARHPASVVSSGAISLSWYGNVIHAGLPYAPIVQPMKIEVGAESGGTSIARKKRIYGLTVRFFESFGCLWGPDTDNLDIVPFGDGQTPELISDDMEYPFEGPIDTAGDIIITQSGPFPMTILAIIADMEVY